MKITKTRLLSAAVLACGVLFGASHASAALVLATGGATCSVSDVTLGGLDASACEGAYSRNDANQNLNGLFGLSDWVELAMVEMKSGKGGTDAPLTVVNGAGGGGWTVSDFGDAKNVMLVLKGGPSFSAYLLSTMGLDSPASGAWSTAGIVKGNGKSGPDLSHLSIYTTGVVEPTTPIPLPAAAWMLMAGLGGLIAAGRRRKTA